MKFELPKLAYAYDALEPHIDAKTMEIHHSKHHQAYVDKLNAAMEKVPSWQEKPIEQILAQLNQVPFEIRAPIRNNGGGHANHSFFWQCMAPKAGGTPAGKIGKAISTEFGSFDQFKQKFSDAALNRFGSGWAWLVQSKGKLDVMSTPNQDSPLSEGKIPLLTIDVWEHAFYLLRQNRKAEYIEAWWNVVNWKQVEKNYAEALKK